MGPGLEQLTVAGLYFAVILYALASLQWPMGQDQGIYAWVGDVIIQGGMPYRDAFEMKGPASHYSYAATQWLFGRTVWGVRAMDLAFLAFGGLGIWMIGNRIGGLFVAHLSVIFLVYLYGSGGYWNTAQPDVWAAMLLAWAILIVTDTSKAQTGRIMIFGAILGLCALYKSVYACFLPLAMIAVNQVVEARWKDRLRAFIMACVASAMVGLFALLWFYFQGAGTDFLEVQLGFNRQVHATLHHRGLGEHALAIARFIKAQPPVLLMLAPFGLFVIWRSSPRSGANLALWALLAVIFVMLQDKYYTYHWTPLYLPVAVMAAYGLGELRNLLLQASKNNTAHALSYRLGACWFTIVAAVSIYPAEEVAHVLSYMVGRLPESAYYDRYAESGGNFSFVADRQVATYLADRTDAEDYVQVWGFEPLINYLSNRRVPSRFGVSYPLVVGKNIPGYYDKYRREFAAAIHEHKPKYIIVADRDASNQSPNSSKTLLAQFPEFHLILERNYRLETTIEDFDIWRRNI